MKEQGNDMDRIQQDAMRRMQEMQARAKIPQPQRAQPQKSSPQQTQSNGQRSPQQTQHTQRAMHGAPVPQRETPPAHVPEEKPSDLSKPHSDLFGNLFDDKERNLILILILILSGENADSSLILALMYLII